MRINTHCHVFNLKSVFTESTKDTFKNRLKESGLSPLLSELLVELFDDIFMSKSRVSEDRDRDLIRKMKTILRRRKDLTPELKQEVDEDDDKLLELVRAPRDILDRLRRYWEYRGDDAYKDAVEVTLVDIYRYVKAALYSTMDENVDLMLEELGADFLLTPLMMDIHAADEPPGFYRDHIEKTRRQVIRHPGRVLPFYAVNPNRPGFLNLMRETFQQGGFVGVKLYPSLGYDIETNEMEEIFSFCDEFEIPIITHCTPGGFRYSDETADFCDPTRFETLIHKNKNLKICFAHFGGDDYFLEQNMEEKSYRWTRKIIELMRTPELKNRVFADISYHSGPMEKPEKGQLYFDNLQNLLMDDVIRAQILWGSDAFMIYVRLSEASYWDFFRSRIEDFNILNQLVEDNPKRFLGLDSGNGDVGKNIAAYVDYVIQHLHEIGEMSAIPPWLNSSIQDELINGRI